MTAKRIWQLAFGIAATAAILAAAGIAGGWESAAVVLLIGIFVWAKVLW